jgi:ribosomal-protein-serine acetyltransferase
MLGNVFQCTESIYNEKGFKEFCRITVKSRKGDYIMFVHRIGPDIVLKKLELRHAEEVFELTDRSREHLRKWLPFISMTNTIDDTRGFMKFSMDQYAANNGCQVGIWYKGEFAGVIGQHAINWSNKSTSIGYWLGDGFEGKGIMTKACHAMLEYSFLELGLERVEIRVATGNVKSQAIPGRLGFTLEGCLRRNEWLYDHYVDHFVYSLLRDEFLLFSQKS